MVGNLNAERIAAWNAADHGHRPEHEQSLDAVVRRARGHNLNFSTAVEPAILVAGLVFISVKTPTKTGDLGRDR